MLAVNCCRCLALSKQVHRKVAFNVASFAQGFRSNIAKIKLISRTLRLKQVSCLQSDSVRMKIGVLAFSGVIFHKGILTACCKQARSLPDLTTQCSETHPHVKKTEANFQFKTFLRILRPQLFYLFIAIGCSFVVAIINIKIPILLGDLISCLQSITVSNDDILRPTYISLIKFPALKLVASYLIQGIFTFGYITALSTVGENIACSLRRELFSHIIRQDISFFDSHKTHEIMSRLTNDIQEFKSSFKLCIGQGLKAIIQASGCVVSLYLLSAKLTGFLIILVPTIVTIGTYLGTKLRSLSRKCQAQVAKASEVAGEAIGNVRTVRAFAMEEKEDSLYADEIEHVSKMNRELGSFIGAFQGLSSIALNGIVLSVIGTGGYLMWIEELSAGNLMSFLVATQTIQRSLMQMSVLFGQCVRGMSAGTRIFEGLVDIQIVPHTLVSPIYAPPCIWCSIRQQLVYQQHGALVVHGFEQLF